jgi:tryptophanyl-tRNA synthetase
VFAYADRYLPRIGYTPVSHFASAMIPGLASEKMSSSAPDASKIMFSDRKEVVKAKIDGAHVADLATDHNALMSSFKHIVFPLCHMGITDTEVLAVELVDGSSKKYEAFAALEEDIFQGLTDVKSLQAGLTTALDHILGQVQRDYDDNHEWQMVDRMGYASS